MKFKPIIWSLTTGRMKKGIRGRTKVPFANAVMGKIA